MFESIPRIRQKLTALRQVGLGYIQLGQPATTLSGGEAQRVKLASELSRKATGRTLYVLDEPTTGLHFSDIELLTHALFGLRDAGNSVLLIEHNIELIACADWVIDMGPEGGNNGGSIVVAGTPEEVARTPGSHTGLYLKQALADVGKPPVKAAAPKRPAKEICQSALNPSNALRFHFLWGDHRQVTAPQHTSQASQRRARALPTAGAGRPCRACPLDVARF